MNKKELSRENILEALEKLLLVYLHEKSKLAEEFSVKMAKIKYAHDKNAMKKAIDAAFHASCLSTLADKKWEAHSIALGYLGEYGHSWEDKVH